MTAASFSDGKRFQLQIHFYGDLPRFLRPQRGVTPVLRYLSEKTSAKDAIEACGVPHPEVDLILVNGQPVDFVYCLTAPATLEVYPYSPAPDLFSDARLQLRGVSRFVADGHLGKLTRDLRLLGIDVSYHSAATDQQLVAISAGENRALLTRDRPLLMHAAVRAGYYPRSQVAAEQTREVLQRFQLRERLAPFTRCLRCNGSLLTVAKSEVLEKLQPLTKLYYEEFRRCPACKQIYWSGSHAAKLQARLRELLE